jgi:hypothetical protein
VTRWQRQQRKHRSPCWAHGVGPADPGLAHQQNQAFLTPQCAVWAMQPAAGKDQACTLLSACVVSGACAVSVLTCTTVIACVHSKRSMPQSSIPVPRPDQVLSLIKARRSIYPKDYTGVKVSGAGLLSAFLLSIPLPPMTQCLTSARVIPHQPHRGPREQQHFQTRVPCICWTTELVSFIS